MDSAANNKSKKPVGLEPDLGLAEETILFWAKIYLLVMVLYITNVVREKNKLFLVSCAKKVKINLLN